MIDTSKVFVFLEEDLGIDVSLITADTALFSTGILDSFSLVNLMMFLESEGGFRIKSIDVNLENLDSINRIVAFADRSTNEFRQAS